MAVAVETEATVADGEAAVVAEAQDSRVPMRPLSGEAVGDVVAHSTGFLEGDFFSKTFPSMVRYTT
jgi:hypothetical protein